MNLTNQEVFDKLKIEVIFHQKKGGETMSVLGYGRGNVEEFIAKVKEICQDEKRQPKDFRSDYKVIIGTENGRVAFLPAENKKGEVVTLVIHSLDQKQIRIIEEAVKKINGLQVTIKSHLASWEIPTTFPPF